jgi:hypothetical protein
VDAVARDVANDTGVSGGSQMTKSGSVSEAASAEVSLCMCRCGCTNLLVAGNVCFRCQHRRHQNWVGFENLLAEIRGPDTPGR